MPSKSPFRRPRHLKRAKFAAQRRHNLMTISVYSVEICHAPNLAVGCKVPVLAIATLRATRCPTLNLRMAMAPFTTHARSEEHTSELQPLMRISYAVFCMKKKNINYTAFHIRRLLL